MTRAEVLTRRALGKLRLHREALFEVLAECPTSAPSSAEHTRLQAMHRRMIELLGMPSPGPWVPAGYWSPELYPEFHRHRTGVVVARGARWPAER